MVDGIATTSRQELTRRAIERSFAPGEALFHRGDRSDDLFLLRKGRVKLWRSLENGTTLTLALHQAGDIVGLVGAFRRSTHVVTATAIVPVTATTVRGAVLRDLCSRDAALAANVNAALAARVTIMIDRLEELAPLSVERRIARVLFRLGREQASEAAGAPVRIPLSRSDIAELARTTIPTVSRIMGRWRAAGLVDGKRGLVVIPRLDAIEGVGRDAG